VCVFVVCGCARVGARVCCACACAWVCSPATRLCVVSGILLLRSLLFLPAALCVGYVVFSAFVFPTCLSVLCVSAFFEFSLTEDATRGLGPGPRQAHPRLPLVLSNAACAMSPASSSLLCRDPLYSRTRFKVTPPGSLSPRASNATSHSAPRAAHVSSSRRPARGLIGRPTP
jgi:hypothetical protein